MILKRLHSFHRDERGQIIYLTIVSIVVFVSLAALIINSGNAVTRKLETQNAVDAAAVSGATWIARGMNIISMNNVAMTEIMALIVVLRALRETWDDGYNRAVRILAVGGPACAAAGLIPIIGTGISAACKTYLQLVEVAKEYFEFHRRAFGDLIDQATRPDSGLLWQVLKGLEFLSDGIQRSFPVLAPVEAERIGQANKAQRVLMYPLRLVPPGLTMPVEKGNFSDICHPTKYGSPSSYPPPLQRGYVPLLLEMFGRRYSYDEGPLIVTRNMANGPMLRLALGTVALGGQLERRTDQNFSNFCRDSGSGNYSSSRADPKIFLLKGAQRSTNRSTNYLASVKRELNYLGIAWRPTESIFMQARFRNPQDYVCAYGQARVFNSTSFDLFTQDWRVKLVKADLLDTDQLALFTLAGSCGNPSLMLAKSLSNH